MTVVKEIMPKIIPNRGKHIDISKYKAADSSTLAYRESLKKRGIVSVFRSGYTREEIEQFRNK